MVHAIIAQELFWKSSPDAEERVVEDVDEVRKLLFGLMRRIVEPENVLIAPYEECGIIGAWNILLSSIHRVMGRDFASD